MRWANVACTVDMAYFLLDLETCRWADKKPNSVSAFGKFCCKTKSVQKQLTVASLIDAVPAQCNAAKLEPSWHVFRAADISTCRAVKHSNPAAEAPLDCLPRAGLHSGWCTT